MSVEHAPRRRTWLEKGLLLAGSAGFVATGYVLHNKHYFDVGLSHDKRGSVSGLTLSGPFTPAPETTLDMSNPAELTAKLRSRASKLDWCTNSVISFGNDSSTSTDSKVCANPTTLHVNSSGNVTIALSLNPKPANGIVADLCGTFTKNPESYWQITNEINHTFKGLATDAFGKSGANNMQLSVLIDEGKSCVIPEPTGITTDTSGVPSTIASDTTGVANG